MNELMACVRAASLNVTSWDDCQMECRGFETNSWRILEATTKTHRNDFNSPTLWIFFLHISLDISFLTNPSFPLVREKETGVKHTSTCFYLSSVISCSQVLINQDYLWLIMSNHNNSAAALCFDSPSEKSLTKSGKRDEIGRLDQVCGLQKF